MPSPKPADPVHASDADWNQMRETVLMIALAAGQVEAAMRESNTSVDVLTDTFTSLADTVHQTDAAVANLPDSAANSLLKAGIQENTRLMTAKVHQAIVAFQFYDKLAQRLAHVCHSLESLSELVSDHGRLLVPAEWVALQDQIRSRYTMVEEREMFDAVIGGVSVAEALEHYTEVRMKEVEDSGGEIEFF